MKIYFIFVLILFCLASSVSASSYDVEFSQVDGAVLVRHNLSLENSAQISIPIPADARSISSNAQYLIENNIITAETKSIQISYLTNEFLEKSGEGYYFVAKVPFQFNFSSADIRLILEEGYHLEENKAFPAPSAIGTDGTQIYLDWHLSNVPVSSDMPLFVSIVSPKSQASIWTTLIISALLIVLILYYFYKNFFDNRKDRKKEQSPIESHLIESEKAVIHILKSADRGEIWQKELQIKTGFSKAKLSRVIRNLESRNLVDKVPFGNTNKIRLL